MDKSYLMGVDISPIGIYSHWSPLADYSTAQLAAISDTLPVPSNFVLAFPEEHWKYGTNNIKDIQVGNFSDPTLEEILSLYNVNEETPEEFYAQYNIQQGPMRQKAAKLQALKRLLDYVNASNGLQIPSNLVDELKPLIKKVNKHNTYKVPEEAARNIVQDRIIKVSLDERNMLPGYSPIDEAMAMFTNILKKIEDPQALQRDLDDGISKYRLQYANSVGKQDVGVMANGLKAFFAITQYLNKYRKDPNFVESNRYFLNKINLGRGAKYFSSISDIRFEQEAIKALNNALHAICPNTTQNISLANHDASLLISSLISLATDNAKEMALAKMNASLDLSCMHLYLVALGYSAEEVLKFTTGPEFSELTKRLNNSFFEEKKSVKNVISELVAENPQKYSTLKYIYSAAQEMTSLARILGINQGVKVDEFKMNNFYKNVSNLITSQTENLGIGLGIEKGLIKIVDVDGESEYSINDGIPYLLSAKQNIPISELSQGWIRHNQEKLQRLQQINDAEKYFSDDLKIDLVRYYQDKKYHDFVVELYDIIKNSFNVFDVIDSLQHFSKMFEAFTYSTQYLKSQSSRAKFLLDDSEQLYNAHKIYNYISEQEEDPYGNVHTSSKKVFNRVRFSEPIQRKANRFYDMQVLKEFIQDQGQNYIIQYLDDDDKTQTIDIRSNKGILQFGKFITYDLIPALIEKFPKNKFLTYLKPDFRKVSGNSTEMFLPKYVFNFDIDNLVSISDENKSFYVNKGFLDLKGIKLKDIIDDVEIGGDLNVTDLIMLYDRIVSMSSYGQGSLDRAFELYSEQTKNTIPVQIAKIIQQHDRGEKILNTNAVEFLAFCYADQIRRHQKGIMHYDRTKVDGEWTEKTFDISDNYIIGLDEKSQENSGAKTAENLLKLIKQGTIEVTRDPYYLSFINFDGQVIYQLPFSQDLTIDNLIKALIDRKETHPQEIEVFAEDLNELATTVKVQPLKSYQTLAVYKTFQEHLSKLGVPVEIVNLDDNINGAVQDGKILLNRKSSVTSTPMHELMHMVLAVMKSDSYKAYEKLLNLANKTTPFNDEYMQVLQNPLYENMMDNDKQEEALCRIFEKLGTDQLNLETLVNDQGNNIYDSLQDMLLPYIIKTFGISAPSDFIQFLKDTISDLPGRNSTLFMRKSSDGNGYIAQRNKIVQSVKVSNYIQKLLGTLNSPLIETEC